MKVAGLFPSRGLVGSRMMEAVDKNLEGYDHVKFYSHDLPIPESFNVLTQKLLDSDSEYGWFVEEDVVPPPAALHHLFSEEAAIAFVDYPLKNFPDRPCYGIYKKKLIWIGLGCTLVHREVFERLGHPWFQTQWKYVSVHSGSACTEHVVKIVPDPDRPYGGQDLFFCYNALRLGFDIRIVMGQRCEHPVPVRFQSVMDSVEVINDQEASQEADDSPEIRQLVPESRVLGQSADLDRIRRSGSPA